MKATARAPRAHDLTEVIRPASESSASTVSRYQGFGESHDCLDQQSDDNDGDGEQYHGKCEGSFANRVLDPGADRPVPDDIEHVLERPYQNGSSKQKRDCTNHANAADRAFEGLGHARSQPHRHLLAQIPPAAP
jgi:hypothetical protein